MRRYTLPLAILVVLPLFGSDSPKDYDGTMAEAQIEGTWRLTDSWKQSNQKKIPFSVIEEILTLGNNNFAFKGDGAAWDGAYVIDRTRKPYRLNCAASEGRYKGHPYKWIYQIEGDTLTIAGGFAPDDPRRPNGFNDEGCYIWKYQRVK